MSIVLRIEYNNANETWDLFDDDHDRRIQSFDTLKRNLAIKTAVKRMAECSGYSTLEVLDENGQFSEMIAHGSNNEGPTGEITQRKKGGVLRKFHISEIDNYW